MRNFSQKNILIGSLVVLIVSIVFNVFFLFRKHSASSAPTAVEISDYELNQETGWKTYSDLNYGYSIEYPPNWTVKEVFAKYRAKNLLRILTFRPGIFLGKDVSYDFNSTATLSVSKERFEEAIKESSYRLNNASKKNVVMLGGVSAVRIKGEMPDWDYEKNQSTKEQVTVIVMPLGQHTLIFSFSSKQSLYKNDYSEILETMLYSIKLI